MSEPLRRTQVCVSLVRLSLVSGAYKFLQCSSAQDAWQNYLCDDVTWSWIMWYMVTMCFQAANVNQCHLSLTLAQTWNCCHASCSRLQSICCLLYTTPHSLLDKQYSMPNIASQDVVSLQAQVEVLKSEVLDWPLHVLRFLRTQYLCPLSLTCVCRCFACKKSLETCMYLTWAPYGEPMQPCRSTRKHYSWRLE